MSKKKKKEVADFQYLLNLPMRLMEFLATWLYVDIDNLIVAQQLAQAGTAYRERELPKGRSKETRLLYVPCDDIKVVQSQILTHILRFIPIHFATFGCRNGVGALDGARKLAGFTQSLYTLDLRHAFPSVTRRRVEVHLTRPLEFQLGQFGYPLTKEDIQLLIQSVVDLVVFRDSIPQGAPSSPALLNIACRNLDRLLTEFLCQLKEETGTDFRYVRYVDDLAFGASIPQGFREKDRHQIKKIIDECGFHPHPQKEKYLPELGKRQQAEFLGVRLHEDGHLTLPRKTLNAYRARLHKIIETGRPVSEESRREANGLIGYLNQVYGEKLPSIVRETVEQVRGILMRES